jgi:radical SAM superfamily enzyme YgiQ (UPF0313 family)
MKRAGCLNLHVGFENGNDETLQKYNKGINVCAMYRFMDAVKKAGIKVHGDFILSPEDTDTEIEQTIDFAVKLNPYTAQFQSLVNYDDTDNNERIKQWQRKAYKRFYVSPLAIKQVFSQIGKPKIIMESIKSCLMK